MPPDVACGWFSRDRAGDGEKLRSPYCKPIGPPLNRPRPQGLWPPSGPPVGWPVRSMG